MTFGYEKLQKKHKGLEHQINRKISNDIHNIQQTLEALTIQNQSQDIGFVQNNNNILQKKINKERKQQRNKNITNTNTSIEENTNITDYKTKTDWYASLLMYNSY